MPKTLAVGPELLVYFEKTCRASRETFGNSENRRSIREQFETESVRETTVHGVNLSLAAERGAKYQKSAAAAAFQHASAIAQQQRQLRQLQHSVQEPGQQQPGQQQTGQQQPGQQQPGQQQQQQQLHQHQAPDAVAAAAHAAGVSRQAVSDGVAASRAFAELPEDSIVSEVPLAALPQWQQQEQQHALGQQLPPNQQPYQQQQHQQHQLPRQPQQQQQQQQQYQPLPLGVQQQSQQQQQLQFQQPLQQQPAAALPVLLPPAAADDLTGLSDPVLGLRKHAVQTFIFLVNDELQARPVPPQSSRWLYEGFVPVATRAAAMDVSGAVWDKLLDAAIARRNEAGDEEVVLPPWGPDPSAQLPQKGERLAVTLRCKWHNAPQEAPCPSGVQITVKVADILTPLAGEWVPLYVTYGSRLDANGKLSSLPVSAPLHPDCICCINKDVQQPQPDRAAGQPSTPWQLYHAAEGAYSVTNSLIKAAMQLLYGSLDSSATGPARVAMEAAATGRIDFEKIAAGNHTGQLQLAAARATSKALTGSSVYSKHSVDAAAGALFGISSAEADIRRRNLQEGTTAHPMLEMWKVGRKVYGSFLAASWAPHLFVLLGCEQGLKAMASLLIKAAEEGVCSGIHFDISRGVMSQYRELWGLDKLVNVGVISFPHPAAKGIRPLIAGLLLSTRSTFEVIKEAFEKLRKSYKQLHQHQARCGVAAERTL